ncbi:MAG: hypothetical protein CVU54_09920 [Deltaproteobacteria bacterium HGW-Deltaproteobacteria-12]|jgi:hypothetical protein|nr:MAG: hypothetical protein CVU54_09920 [Deltaproteobacteria bacterium HGW-Deltaproteobacteria-12]
MKGKKISGKFGGIIVGQHLLILCLVVSIFLFAINPESTFAQRKNKMPDISQKSRPEWGNNWCAPTAVGNSFLWLAKEYPWLDPLVKVNGTGPKMSGETLIDVLGSVDMHTDPNRGTIDANTKAGKESYIERHGLKNKISVEEMEWPTRQWLKEQYDKGQDIELGIGYYLWNAATNKWERKNGGHVQTYGEYIIPGKRQGGMLYHWLISY